MEDVGEDRRIVLNIPWRNRKEGRKEGRKVVHCVRLVREREKWRVLANTVVNLLVPQNSENVFDCLMTWWPLKHDSVLRSQSFSYCCCTISDEKRL